MIPFPSFFLYFEIKSPSWSLLRAALAILELTMCTRLVPNSERCD